MPSALDIARHHLKTRLSKMAVSRQGLSQPQFAHECKARTVGERVLLVGIAEKIRTRILGSFKGNHLFPDPLTRSNTLPPLSSGV